MLYFVVDDIDIGTLAMIDEADLHMNITACGAMVKVCIRATSEEK